MKKVIAVFGSLLVLASTKSKAQDPSHVPVKKETVKPASGTAPKADAVEQFLKIGTINPKQTGEKTTSVAKGVNPALSKGANPTYKGANPTYKGANPTYKGAQSATNNQVAPRHTPPPPNNQVAPHHTGPKG